MNKETVQVYVRTRPTSSFAQGMLSLQPETNSIEVNIKDAETDAVDNQQKKWNFQVDKILHNASQEFVFDTCGRDIVDSCLEGYNGTIMAYGQTGAGKTFTMNGGTQNYTHRGLIPRCLGYLFKEIKSKPEIATHVRLSYIEIYNETFYDLLSDSEADSQSIAIREGSGGSVEVKGLTKPIVQSEEDALSLLFEGEQNRSIAMHQMNSNSTRSHCIFTIYLERRSRVESSEKVVSAKFNLVDLAGSERVGKTGSSGQTLKEAKYINKSLSFLEQVVIALSSRRDHVPFRQSKLTSLLRDSLGGNSKTRLIANIWAEKAQLDETVSTLKFALRMMRVPSSASVNVKLDPELLVRKLQKEIRELKQELAMHDTLANRSNVQYEPYTPEQQTELRRTVNKYVQGEISNIEVTNLRQINEVFQQFKNIVLDYKVQMEQGGQLADGVASAKDPASRAQSAHSRHPDDGMVGDEVGDGFAVGLAHDNARPSSQMEGIDVTKQARQAAATKSKEEMDAHQRMLAARGNVEEEEEEVDEDVPRPTEDQALLEYKSGKGKEAQETYEQNKKELASKKVALKTISIQVNKTKKEIDCLNQQISMIQAQRAADQQQTADGVQVIDEEEYALISKRKEAKRVYQTQFGERKILHSEVDYLRGLVEQSKMSFVNKFLEWYKDKYGDVQPEASGNNDDDVLDDGEKFDKMELEKLMAEDPDSISFHNARKLANKGKSRPGKNRRK